LSAIDCPEKGPAYGKRAKQAASDLAFGREVTVQTYAHDKYQRTLGDVILSDGMNLYQELVKQSWLVVSEVCVVEYGAGAVRS
jgi:endonuclease YncB( thermonuclease family)